MYQMRIVRVRFVMKSSYPFIANIKFCLSIPDDF